MKKSVRCLFILFCFFLLISNSTKAQTATTTISYSGFTNQCCTSNSVPYTCFNEVACSACTYCGLFTNSSTKTFTNPVPAGNIVTQIDISWYGLNCGGSVSVAINGTTIGSSPILNGACTCSSLSSGSSTGTTIGNFPCGLAGYNNAAAATETFVATFTGQTCVSSAQLTIHYVPANEAVPAFNPSLPSGPTSVCSGVSNTYSIPAVANATGYTWSISPAGAGTINSGQGSTSVNASFTSAGQICVIANNLCGPSSQSCLSVGLNSNSTAPTSASANPNPVCASATTTLTVAGGSLGTGAAYHWYTGSCNGTLIGTGTTITVSPSTATTYYADIVGTCNTTACTSVLVNIGGTTATPGAPTGSASPCGGTTQTYNTTGTTGATSYTWTVPAGSTINSGQGTTSISVTLGSTSGNVCVYAVGSCGASATACTPVTITNIPTTPGSITGTTPVCLGSDNYSISAVAGATSYTWTTTGGGTISNGTTATATITWTTSGVYIVSVKAINACGTSSQNTFNITVNPPPTITINSSTTTVCSGSSTTFTATGASTYTWTPLGTVSPTTGSVVTATPIVSPTVYTATATDGNGCVGANTISINVNPTPTVSISGGGGNSQTVCGGGLVNSTVAAINFTVTPSGTINWTNSNTAIGIGGSGSGPIGSYPAPTVTVGTSTTGVITATATSGGCASTNSTQLTYTVTVNQIPGSTTATINPANCGVNNGTITGLTGTGGSGFYSYSWNGGAFSASSNYTNGAGTYSVEIKDNTTGCIYSQNFTIPNAGAPAAPAVTPSATMACVGGSVVLSITSPVAGVTYNWTEANGTTGSGTTYTITNIPASPNPYTIGVTGTSLGCTGAATTTSITVNPLPTPPVLTAPTGTNNAYCQGYPTPLTVNSGTNTAVWYSGGIVVHVGNSFTPPVSLPVGTYTYSVIDSIPAVNGCVNAPASANTLTLSLTVNPTPPAPILTAPTGTNNAYCQGFPTSLTVNSGTNTAVWYSAGTVVNTGSSYTPPVGLPAGTYTFSVIDSIPAVNGCTNAPQSANTVTLTLVVNPIPVAPILTAPTGTNNAYCQGYPTPLTVSSGTANPSPVAVWYSGGIVVHVGNSFTPPVSLPVGTYTYSVIDSIPAVNGCVNAPASANTLTLSLTVNPTPPAPILTAPTGTNNAYCQGFPTSLTVNSGTNTAVWYSAGTVVNTGSSYTPPVGLPAGTYTFSVIDSIPAVNGCTNAPQSANTVTLTLVVNPLPAPPVLTAPTGTNNAYCQGFPTPLTVNTGTNAAVWYSAGTVVNTGSSFTPPAGLPVGTYTYSVIDSIPAVNGCINAPQSANTVTLTLVVNANPSIDVSGAIEDTAKCGQPTGGVNGIANAVGGKPYIHYQWTGPGTTVADTLPNLSNVSVGGTYNLQITDANGCHAAGTGALGVNTFTVPAIVSPVASFSTSPSPATGGVPLTVVFTNQSTVGVTNSTGYVWNFGDGSPNSNALSPTHTYTMANTYSATLTAYNGSCASSPLNVIIIADVPTTIIIPNIFSPNGDGKNDEFFIVNTGMTSLNCQIFSRWGQLLATLTSPQQSWDGLAPNGDKAPEGTYMFILEAQGLDGKIYKQQGTLMLVR